MKNQYFGDINDYRKYGLLRILQSKGNGRLLVAWMLTPEDARPDGKLRNYLQVPDSWMQYDPELYVGLSGLLQQASNPAVSLIENSTLLPRTSYHSAPVPDSAAERDVWRQGLLNSAHDADIVFVDPDNGIQIASKPVGRKDSSKFVTWQEIHGLWQIGCSILIYQHFRREPRVEFALRSVSELREKIGARIIEAIQTPYVLFLLAAQEQHAPQFQEVVSSLPQYGMVKPRRRRWLTRFPMS